MAVGGCTGLTDNVRLRGTHEFSPFEAEVAAVAAAATLAAAAWSGKCEPISKGRLGDAEACSSSMQSLTAKHINCDQSCETWSAAVCTGRGAVACSAAVCDCWKQSTWIVTCPMGRALLPAQLLCLPFALPSRRRRTQGVHLFTAPIACALAHHINASPPAHKVAIGVHATTVRPRSPPSFPSLWKRSAVRLSACCLLARPSARRLLTRLSVCPVSIRLPARHVLMSLPAFHVFMRLSACHMLMGLSPCGMMQSKSSDASLELSG
eukprot:1158522-Pelagomonas_calceolata.AAC.1